MSFSSTHAEHARAIGDYQRRTAAAGDFLHGAEHRHRHAAAQCLDVLADGVGGTLADLPAVNIDAMNQRCRSYLLIKTVMINRRTTASLPLAHCPRLQQSG